VEVDGEIKGLTIGKPETKEGLKNTVLDLDSWKVDTRPSLPKSNGQN
jgi:hypothetical protein